MTYQIDKLIDNLISDLGKNRTEETSLYTVREYLSTHLSDKLILDRKQVEEMIGKRKNKSYRDELGNVLRDNFIKDLQSLLHNKEDDSE